MVALGYVFAFVIGAAIGSFLNVCIYRLPRDMSLLSPPSHCTWCNEPVLWYDNLPVATYFALAGRCRHCGARFSIRYAAIEAFTGLVFVYLARHFFLRPGVEFEPMLMLRAAVLCSALIVVSMVDAERQIIPDEITLSGLVVGPVFSMICPGLHDLNEPVTRWASAMLGASGCPRTAALVASLTGMVVAAGFIYLTGAVGTRVFRKDAMGLGDVKLMGMLGGFLGWRAGLGTIMIGCVYGAVIGVVIWAIRRESRIPFGPYLSLGSVTVMLFTPQLMALFEWWQRLVSPVPPMY